MSEAGTAVRDQQAAELARELRSARRKLYGAVAFLSLLGLLMVYSASWCRVEAGESGLGYFLRQATWLLAGAAGAVVVAYLDYRRFGWAKWPVLAATMGLLLLVLVPGLGSEVRGARRWFRFWGLGFQASEFAKVGLVVFLAYFSAGRQEVMQKFWSGFAPAVLVVGAGFALIAAEPDLGMALLWAAVGGLVLFSAGARLWHCLFAGLLASPVIVWLMLFKMPYILGRLEAFWIRRRRQAARHTRRCRASPRSAAAVSSGSNWAARS